MTDLKKVYEEQIKPKLKEDLGLSNVMQVPRITQITLNMGVGEALNDRKQLEAAVADMQAIAGQKPIITNARRSIAGFKIRDGYPIGCKVTLRRSRMYEFLDRLINIALPRQRDFRGISPSHSMDVAIFQWVFLSRLYLQKSTTTKLIGSAAWM